MRDIAPIQNPAFLLRAGFASPEGAEGEGQDEGPRPKIPLTLTLSPTGERELWSGLCSAMLANAGALH